MAATTSSAGASTRPQDHLAGVDRVLVTGASGFIAGHVVQVLMEAGLRVRGTVRSLRNEAKVAHLRALCPGAKYPLELVEADLLQPDSWPAAVAGCTHVMHVASPAPASLPKHEDELVKPAVEGTLNVLRAAHAAGCRRIVVTSSNSAVYNGHHEKLLAGHVFNEEDWSIPEKATGMHAYVKAKTNAERAAWEFCNKNGIKLATILPVLVIGEVMNGNGVPGSMTSIFKLINGSLPLVPDLTWSLVHVRDVAEAHFRALVLPQAAGHRFLACAGERTFTHLARVLRGVYGPRGFAVPSLPLPNWLVHLLAPVVPVFKLVAPKLGVKMKTDGSKATRVLGLEYRSVDEAALEGAESLVRHGLVKPTRGKRNAVLAIVVVLVGAAVFALLKSRGL